MTEATFATRELIDEHDAVVGTVSFGVPTPRGRTMRGDEWNCTVTIVLDGSETLQTRVGLDQVQAVFAALEFAYHYLNGLDRSLRWHYGAAHDLGLPEFFWATPFEVATRRRVEAAKDREIAAIIAERDAAT